MIDKTNDPDPWAKVRRLGEIASTAPKRQLQRRRTSADRPALAVGYLRVSTPGQARHGVSLEAQRAAVEGEAQRRGLRLLAVFTDDGVSGKRSNRPGLRQAMELAKTRRATMVVYSLSRFARSADDALALIGDLDRAGASFVSVSEAVRTNDACGRMVLGMLAVVAQFEREIIGERTAANFAHLRAKGRKTGGSVPYGFTVDAEGLLTRHPTEGGIVDGIRGLRSTGMSHREIVATLNREGVPTRTGSPWQLTSVARIIARGECADCQ